MKRVLSYLLPYWPKLLISVIIAGVGTVCDLMLPSIMSGIMNNGIYLGDLEYIVIQCVYMLIFAAVGFGAAIFCAKLSCVVVADFCGDIREAVFKRVNQMSFAQFGKLGTAALVTRATHDAETLSWLASELASSVLTIPLLFFGGVIMTMNKSVSLGCIILLFLPVIIGVVVVIGKRILPLWETSDKYIDKQNDIMRQRLRGIRVIRAFNSEEKEHDRISEATHIMAQNIIKGNVAMGLITPLATFLLNFAIVLIVYFGGFQMERGSGLSGGDIFAIIQYVSLVSSSVIFGAFSIIMLPHAKVAARRISEVFDGDIQQTANCGQFGALSGKIDFEGVSFTYDGAQAPAVKNITMHIAPGEKIAIIGGTGSGKSTLVSLLLAFRNPTEGRILLDAVSSSELDQHMIRQNVSCVLQNTTIYSGTIGENIRMGKQNATEQEIWEALSVAQAADFVKDYPEGIDHVITQSGKNLSGGQKQRLSIARAVIKNAPIFIFDDSFSALDFLTEARLRAQLAESIQGKTQIIITQRITSAMHADRIYVMDKGELLDWGSHGQLLHRCQVYREIYESQTGGAAT